MALRPLVKPVVKASLLKRPGHFAVGLQDILWPIPCQDGRFIGTGNQVDLGWNKTGLTGLLAADITDQSFPIVTEAAGLSRDQAKHIRMVDSRVYRS